jgi:anhydro-N-acetylmuramic acid kinase
VSEQLGIGMLSGSGRNGVDAVLVNFTQDAMDLLHAKCTPYPVAIARSLDQLAEAGQPPGAGLFGLLDEQLGRFFARTAQDLVREAGLEMRDVAFIGSHGQDPWHAPPDHLPASIQLGNGQWIARNTGVTTVADFRRADIEAGGTGAPLAPLLHARLFRNAGEDRAVLHIGGIARLTSLPAGGEIRGYDIGPGNCLLDAWAMRHLRRPYDDGGKWAATGAVIEPLLARMLEDPYFKQAPPKSTRPGHFDLPWLENMLDNPDTGEADVQATLAELTARAVARGLPARPARLLLCGGGAHNGHLRARLSNALPDTVVESTAGYGADPDWVEGLLFAWLARERLAGRPQDTPPLTGAGQPVLLGDIFNPDPQGGRLP